MSNRESKFIDYPVAITGQYWDKDNSPVVSIVCVTYNHEKFIEDAIKGFLMQQTTFPVEIIIYDDASTDRTPKVIQEYKEKYSGLITTILQEENQYSKGYNPFHQFVYPRARGKYIALCEGDDFWTDSLKMQKQVELMEGNPEAVLSYHNFKNKADFITEEEKKFFESTGEIIGKIYLKPRTCTILFRNLFRDTNYPDKLLQAPNGDQALRFFLSQYGKFLPINTIKPSIRNVHSGGVMSLQSEKVRLERSLRTWEAILSAYSQTPFRKKLKSRVNRFKYRLMKAEQEGEGLTFKTIKRKLSIKVFYIKSGCFYYDFKSSLRNALVTGLRTILSKKQIDTLKKCEKNR